MKLNMIKKNDTFLQTKRSDVRRLSFLRFNLLFHWLLFLLLIFYAVINIIFTDEDDLLVEKRCFMRCCFCDVGLNKRSDDWIILLFNLKTELLLYVVLCDTTLFISHCVQQQSISSRHNPLESALELWPVLSIPSYRVSNTWNYSETGYPFT